MNKKSGGRRKIEIKKIEDNDRKTVTFSKRRGGLFNKASEICVSTGAEMVILAQSVGGRRVYAFAHPSFDSVVDTYLGNNVSTNSTPVSENSACMYGEYKEKYSGILEALAVEKKKSKNVVEDSGGFWWENSFEDLEIDELETFIKSMEELKNNMTKRADELRDSATSSLVDTIDNANLVGGLVDDQTIFPDLDQFFSNNAGVANEDLMMPALNYDPTGFDNFSFGNEELVLDNHDNEHDLGFGHNIRVQSDFGTFGVPNGLNF